MTREIKDMNEYETSVKGRTYLGTLVLLFGIFFGSLIWLLCAYLNFNPFYELFLIIIK